LLRDTDVNTIPAMILSQVLFAAVVLVLIATPANGATEFNGGTARYDLDGSWSSDQPATGNDGTVNSGIAYADGDLDMNSYHLAINGGTVAIGRAITRGLQVTQTAGRWEDSTGLNATGVSNGLFLGWDTAASTYTLSGAGAVEVARLTVCRFAPGTFNQNGGSVLVTTTTDGGLLLGLDHESNPGSAGTYNLAAGTVQTEGLAIGNAQAAGSTFNFTTGSTGILYVATSNKSASAIEGLITAGDITLGGAAALVSDFDITEVAGGPYDGFTEVKVSGPDLTPPVIWTLSPADGAAAAPIGADLVASFNEAIQAGAGFITLKRASDGSTVESFDVTDSSRLAFAGSTLTIDPTGDLAGGEEYYVLIPATAVKDGSDNFFAGIGAPPDPGSWSFTGDGTAPAGAGSSDVTTGGLLTLGFDEEVRKGSGNIVIRLAGTGNVVRTIEADSAGVVVDDQVVTIDPGALAANTGYYVEVDAGAFTDLSGNPFAGFAGSTDWTFTTPPDVPSEPFPAWGYALNHANDEVTFAWRHNGDKLYHLHSSDDLSTWPVHMDVDGTIYQNILPGAAGFNPLTVPLDPAESARFFVLAEEAGLPYNPYGEIAQSNVNSTLNMFLSPQGKWQIGWDWWGRIVRVNPLEMTDDDWETVPGVKKAWPMQGFEGVEGMAFHPIISEVKDVDGDGELDIFRRRSEHSGEGIERLDYDDGSVVWVSEPVGAMSGDESRLPVFDLHGNGRFSVLQAAREIGHFKLWCFNAGTGTTEWSASFGDGVKRNGGNGQGDVVVGHFLDTTTQAVVVRDGGVLHCYDHTGAEAWTLDTGLRGGDAYAHELYRHDADGDGLDEVFANWQKLMMGLSGDGTILWQDTTQAAHSDYLVCADVDADGETELIYDHQEGVGPAYVVAAMTGNIKMTINYRAEGLGNAQNIAVGDFDPVEPGLEIAICGKNRGLFVWNMLGDLLWQRDVPTSLLSKGDWDGDGDEEITAHALGANVDGIFSVWNGNGERLYAMSFLPSPSNRTWSSEHNGGSWSHATPGGHEGVRRQVDLDGNGRADMILGMGAWHWGSDSILFLMEGP